MRFITRAVIIIVCVLLGSTNICQAAPDLQPNIDMTTIAVMITVIALLLAFFFLMGGVKYVTPENVLDTEIRKNLYEYIDEYPGSHLREIARELDLKPSNAAWHLRKLEQTNLIRSRAIGGKKVYYLVEGGVEAKQRAVAESILRNKNARDIMAFLSEHPGKHLLEIAHALNINHHVVKWHINKLFEAELIEGDTTNSAYPIYYPTEIGRQFMETYNEFLKTTVGNVS
ncbi:MAG TPA: winged helix-turn-helix transcriptional regulator [Thermoplasmata archaeon]|jgi:predicted transcriptional regulator|nr:winged helix-turn-helix transcriptional regulator [Thermoplasmata archaeon]HIH29570.1 winged helix-turn-helix transcriptional regulator [Thermoplasmata archaeon]